MVDATRTAWSLLVGRDRAPTIRFLGIAGVVFVAFSAAGLLRRTSTHLEIFRSAAGFYVVVAVLVGLCTAQAYVNDGLVVDVVISYVVIEGALLSGLLPYGQGGGTGVTGSGSAVLAWDVSWHLLEAGLQFVGYGVASFLVGAGVRRLKEVATTRYGAPS